MHLSIFLFCSRTLTQAEVTVTTASLHAHHHDALASWIHPLASRAILLQTIVQDNCSEALWGSKTWTGWNSDSTERHPWLMPSTASSLNTGCCQSSPLAHTLPLTPGSHHFSSQPRLLPSLACPLSTHPLEKACISSRTLIHCRKVCQGAASTPSETRGIHRPLPSLLDSDMHTLPAVFSQHSSPLLLIHKSNQVCPSLRKFKSIPSLQPKVISVPAISDFILYYPVLSFLWPSSLPFLKQKEHHLTSRPSLHLWNGLVPDTWMAWSPFQLICHLPLRHSLATWY